MAAQPSRLWNLDFFLLWQGQFVSQLGNQAHGIAMLFWLKHAVGSAGMIGLIMMCSMLPGVLLGPFGGTIADHYSRKKIIILADIVSGIVVLVLAGMIFMSADAVGVIVGWMIAAAIILGTVGAVFRPAIAAAIPDLVPAEKVSAANSFNQGSIQTSTLIGQGAGGVLFRVLGAPVLFLVDGLSFLFSAGCAAFITIPQTIPERPSGFRPIMERFRKGTAEGFTYIWRRPGMRNLFLAAAALNFFLSPISVLLPFFIEDHLHATSDWFGFMMAAMGAGAIVGYTVAGIFRAFGRRRMRFIIVMLILDALAIGSLGLAKTAPVSVGIGFIIGLFNAVVNVNIITILQMTTPSEIRGRVFGVLGTISGGLMPIGIGLAGVIADLAHQNIPAIFMVCGAITGACIVLVSTNREFRNFLAYEPAVQESTAVPAE